MCFCGEAFSSAVREVAALCLALNYPTAASVPHSIMDAYKNMLAIGLACKDYSWENLGKVKEILADPSKFAAAAAPAAGGAAPAAAAGKPPYNILSNLYNFWSQKVKS